VSGRPASHHRFGLPAAISIALHAAALVAILLLARHNVWIPSAPDKEAKVELLLVEQKGAGKTTPPSAAPPAHEAKEAEKQHATPPSSPPVSPAPTATPPPLPPPSPTPAESLPVPPTPPDEPPAAARPAPAAIPPEPSAPPVPTTSSAHAASPAPAAIKFNLGGSDSDTNAQAYGHGIIPASPDNRHRNRPPPYPESAALRGEQGAVVVLIHISPLGLTAGADVLESSGHASLDDAVLQAVRTWRFVPAVKDGQPVPFDMPMRFVFSFN
jgi:protein TonB